jgi:hypothetical protein
MSLEIGDDNHTPSGLLDLCLADNLLRLPIPTLDQDIRKEIGDDALRCFLLKGYQIIDILDRFQYLKPFG